MERKPGKKLDGVDVFLAIRRQQVILKMIDEGLDPKAGMELYENTTSIENIDEDRKAFDQGLILTDPDTPSGRLAQQYFRLKIPRPSGK